MFERTKNNARNAFMSLCTSVKRSIHVFKKLYALELTLLLIVAGTISITVAIYAAPNQAFVYQGRLVDANYTPVTNGTYYMKLKLYSDAAGGNANCQWATGSVTNASLATITSNCAEALSTSTIQVTVSHGSFAIHLGDTSLTGGKMPDISNLNFKTTTYYLGVTVCGAGADAASACAAGPSEMTPLLTVTGSTAAASIVSTLQANTSNQVPGSYTQINDADGITVSDATITVDSTAGYPSAGTLLIDTEVMTYTATTATTFTGVVRGTLGTTAATHADNATIKTYLFSGAASTASTTLASDPGAAGTTITVGSTAGYPSSGAIRIENELITYSGTNSTQFTGATRGARGTTGATHAAGTTVKLDLLPTFFITSDGSAFINANLSPFTPSQVALQINGTTSYAFGNDQLGNNYFNIRGGNLDDFSIPLFYRLRPETSVSNSYSAHELLGRNNTLASSASSIYTTLTVTPPIIALTGSTQVTSQMDSILFNRPRIASITEGITDAATFTIAAPPSLSTGVATNLYSMYINGAAVTEGFATPTNAYGLAVAAPTGATNNYAGVFTGGNVGVGTTTPITQLHVPGSVPTAEHISITQAGAGFSSLSIQGRYLYATGKDSGRLYIYDVSKLGNSSPAINLINTGGTATAASPQRVKVAGKYAYILNDGVTDTLQVFDISNPAAPVQKTTGNGVATADDPNSIAIQGKYAYIVSRTGNTLQIFDISNPASPTNIIAFFGGLPSGPNSISVQGRYAYIANSGTNSFSIVDVSAPALPSVVSSRTVVANANGIAVQGRYAYVASSPPASTANGTLQIFDISNPASVPAAIGTVATGNNPTSEFVVQGRYLYLNNPSDGSAAGTLQIFDISNPASPTSLGTVTTGTFPVSPVANGRYVFVPNYTSNTIQVFDVGGSYIQQFEAGGLEMASGQTRGNFTINNDLDVRGGTTIGIGGMYSAGPITVNGLELTSIDSMFSVRNSAGTPLLKIANDSFVMLGFELTSGNSFSFASGAARTIGIETAAGAGNSLTLRSGTSGTGSNLTGGNISLNSGWSRGAGVSKISIQTPQNQTSSNSTANAAGPMFEFVNGHIASLALSSAPSISGCGTSPTIAAGSNDIAGRITLGTGALGAGGCQITFTRAYTTTPQCQTLYQGAIANMNSYVAAVSTTSVSIKFSPTPSPDDSFSYFCIAQGSQ